MTNENCRGKKCPKPSLSSAPPSLTPPGARRSMPGTKGSICPTLRDPLGDQSVAVLEPHRSVTASGDISIPGRSLARARDEGRGHEAADRRLQPHWPDVTRTRETFVLAQEFAA